MGYSAMAETTSMTEFETECRVRVGELRRAFIELYDAVGADPSSPQVFSRKFKVNKTLAWNVARLLQSANPVQAIYFLGIEVLERRGSATRCAAVGARARAVDDRGIPAWECWHPAANRPTR